MNIIENDKVPVESEMALQIVTAYLSNTNCAPQQLAELAHHSLAAARVLLGAAASSNATVQPFAPPPGGGEGGASQPNRKKTAKVVDLQPIPSESDPEDLENGYVRYGRQTVYDDRIICLDDGREVTFLSRHLNRLGIDRNDYLRRHNLPKDYPFTTPGYVARKRDAAKRSGFGKLLRPNRENR
ncbi:MucR family transcriptional regulator [Novosphingobium taihuense]|uniref:Putative transcriptional regulator n=1 Tax=Novosphingobium taihuense TaxID=260085 RepID=A0A7W7AE88_9SPHN|nr:MucR family transcriptional regulator [Novosphingobium taihuense]MBB4615403.1 putative transcriptional regulator [Novosphingobium taihuense]TWH82147.1 MucR family transcriptional regulator [Novosphingobium taihuense]